MKEQIRYTVPDYLGNPTSVPADKVEAFLKRQEELKAMKERGEEIKADPKQAEAVKAALLARIKQAKENTRQEK